MQDKQKWPSTEPCGTLLVAKIYPLRATTVKNTHCCLPAKKLLIYVPLRLLDSNCLISLKINVEQN